MKNKCFFFTSKIFHYLEFIIWMANLCCLCLCLCLLYMYNMADLTCCCCCSQHDDDQQIIPFVERRQRRGQRHIYDGNDLNLKNVKIFCFFNIYKNVIILPLFHAWLFYSCCCCCWFCCYLWTFLFKYSSLSFHFKHIISNDDDNDIW